MRRSNFTLVEVLLALGVVVIGVCSIMVLFPVGANATRDASMETYSADSVDELLSGIKYHLLNGKWTDYVGTGADGTNGSIDSLGTSGEADARFNGKKEGYDSLTESSDWENVTINTKSGFYKYNDSSRAGKEDVYQLVCYRDSSKSLTEDSVDFRAIARVAKSKVNIRINGIDNNIGFDKAVCLNVEVSWPAEAPFDARQKAYYSMEVFNVED